MPRIAATSCDKISGFADDGKTQHHAGIDNRAARRGRRMPISAAGPKVPPAQAIAEPLQAARSQWS